MLCRLKPVSSASYPPCCCLQYNSCLMVYNMSPTKEPDEVNQPIGIAGYVKFGSRSKKSILNICGHLQDRSWSTVKSSDCPSLCYSEFWTVGSMFTDMNPKNTLEDMDSAMTPGRHGMSSELDDPRSTCQCRPITSVKNHVTKLYMPYIWTQPRLPVDTCPNIHEHGMLNFKHKIRDGNGTKWEVQAQEQSQHFTKTCKSFNKHEEDEECLSENCFGGFFNWRKMSG